MFASANALARAYTYPVISSTRSYAGKMGAGLAAFVVLNADGWIVTAAHVLDHGLKAERDGVLVDELDAKVREIEANAAGLAPAKIKRELQRLRATADPDWYRRHAYWWGRDGVVAHDTRIVAGADIAVARLDPFPEEMRATLPVLKNPNFELQPGTSLCRLGFPFSQITSKYDEASDTFGAEGEMTFFPLDGIFTRNIMSGPPLHGQIPVMYLETSSPGLLGQSGGPIFDVHGRIWGIQSRTSHVALGFNPEVMVNGRKSVVPQFINLGYGVHVKTLVAALDELNIAYTMSPD